MADTTSNYNFTIIPYDSYIDVGVINRNTEQIDNVLSEKVDKETGKGLSEENFSHDDKKKLENLENYDDSDVRQIISGLTSRIEELEAKVNGY